MVEEAIRSHGWKARVVEDLSEADVVLSVRLGLSRQPSLRRQARDMGIPILVIKSDTLPQVTRAMAVFCAVRPPKQPQRSLRRIGCPRTMNWLLSRNAGLRWNRW